MRALTDNSNLVLVPSSGLRVARWATISGGIGVLGGAIYGMLFAGFMFLFRVETFSFFHIAGYFAFCGMVAGFMLGVWGGLLDGDNATEATREPSEMEPRIVTKPIYRKADVDPMANSMRSPRPNRIAALSRYDRKNFAAMTSKNSLRN